ncbi:MAG: hypothetical protein MI924_37295 [Chloroflexales bacterium]|nr:hypothetical protein [Chloroflexales bacterium]
MMKERDRQPAGTEKTLQRELGVEQANAAMNQVISRYAQARLPVFDDDPATHEATVELAHTGLLHAWARLRAWLGASQEQLPAQRWLVRAAEVWQHAGRNPDFLAARGRLVQFEGLLAGGDSARAIALNTLERDYLLLTTDLVLAALDPIGGG